MPGASVSARLTVYFDGQFWVALYEREDEDGLSVAHHTFGPEPSLPQILEFVAGDAWLLLDFVPCSEGTERPPTGTMNPKRAQREAGRQMRSGKAATRAHEAMRLALEQQADEAAALRRAEEPEAGRDYEARVAKRKAKRRGH